MDEKDLPDGSMTGVIVNDENILLARIGDRIYAINNICSHFHTHLSNGELLTDLCQVQCPLHDSSFDLRTGEPNDPPAEDPVEVYGVELRNGTIWIGPPHVG
ncbi:MAG: Rieske 2Fe-2S domain-containing protein [Hyphomonas sp.]|nr:Rieske 2Fe-2S domain-containing protein [Hyphomonas sp.]MCC0017608.1 Rieske 2Fe-2S domain-containing protein [Rhodobiaceae bacterium]